MDMIIKCVVLVLVLMGIASFAESRESNSSILMDSRLANLDEHAKESVFVHVHIPKAGGTALGIALSSECHCNLKHQIPYCHSCKQVNSSIGNKVSYSISRLTGWKFGVHPPYAKMKREMEPRVKNGITPVYVIMLRRPFERFISEIRVWGGNEGQAVDWSIVNYRKGGDDVYYPGANSSFLNLKHSGSEAKLRERLRLYASLPNDLYYHNRQVKMIGGEMKHFRNFKENESLGSKFSPISDTEMIRVYHNAKSVLRKAPTVIMGLEERFLEMLCSLEIIYGNLYKFKWDANTATHGHSKTNMTVLASRKDTLYPEVHSEWKQHNELEEKLYAVAEEIFEKQFQASLRLLTRKLERGQISKYRVPHCAPFLNKSSKSKIARIGSSTQFPEGT